MLCQLVVAVNGYGFGTAEHANVQERMAALGQQTPSQETADDDPAHIMPDAARYDALLCRALSRCLESFAIQGCTSYVPLTQAALSQSYVAMVETVSCHQEAALVAPDIRRQL